MSEPIPPREDDVAGHGRFAFTDDDGPAQEAESPVAEQTQGTDDDVSGHTHGRVR